jgi:hypothetical protein
MTAVGETSGGSDRYHVNDGYHVIVKSDRRVISSRASRDVRSTPNAPVAPFDAPSLKHFELNLKHQLSILPLVTRTHAQRRSGH